MTSNNLTIKNLQRPSVQSADPLKKAEEAKTGDTFKTVLASKLEETQQKIHKPDTHSALTELTAPAPFSMTTDEDHQLSSRVSTTLDLFDCYSSLLSDPDKTLREILPVLNQLSDASKGLAGEIHQDGNPDDALINIIDQLLVLVNLEQFKMERGDYTDQGL